MDKALEAAQRAGVVIYPITYSAQKTAWTAKNPPPPADPDFVGVFVELGRLGTANQADYFARQTGGQHLSFSRLQGLEDALGRLGAEIHSQYLLSFVPEDSKNKGYHRLNVEVRGHPGAVVRARPGYWP